MRMSHASNSLFDKTKVLILLSFVLLLVSKSYGFSCPESNGFENAEDLQTAFQFLRGQSENVNGYLRILGEDSVNNPHNSDRDNLVLGQAQRFLGLESGRHLGEGSFSVVFQLTQNYVVKFMPLLVGQTEAYVCFFNMVARRIDNQFDAEFSSYKASNEYQHIVPPLIFVSEGVVLQHLVSGLKPMLRDAKQIRRLIRGGKAYLDQVKKRYRGIEEFRYFFIDESTQNFLFTDGFPSRLKLANVMYWFDPVMPGEILADLIDLGELDAKKGYLDTNERTKLYLIKDKLLEILRSL